MKSVSLFVVAASFAIAACAGTHAATGLGIQRDVITSEEIDATRSIDAYEVVKKLRANFLSYRGRTSFSNTSSGYPTVYLDEQAFGPISSLRTIPAAHISQIRLYRSGDASTRYGNGNMGGVIAVYTRNQ